MGEEEGEQGRHAELLARGGAYATLYAMGFRHANESGSA